MIEYSFEYCTHQEFMDKVDVDSFEILKYDFDHLKTCFLPKKYLWRKFDSPEIILEKSVSKHISLTLLKISPKNSLLFGKNVNGEPRDFRVR